MGMLLVSGPTVFPGYLGYDGPSPFRERDGKRWYITGDLVELDAEDGYIHFSGHRLKRLFESGRRNDFATGPGRAVHAA